MNEPNSPETPETFADAIAKLRTFGAWQDNDRINAVVAAHEREVAELDREAESYHELYSSALQDAKALLADNSRQDATIAELKEALMLCKADLCRACQCLEPRNRCIDCCETLRIARAALEKTSN